MVGWRERSSALGVKCDARSVARIARRQDEWSAKLNSRAIGCIASRNARHREDRELVARERTAVKTSAMTKRWRTP
jgi:hypothetical protein